MNFKYYILNKQIIKYILLKRGKQYSLKTNKSLYRIYDFISHKYSTSTWNLFRTTHIQQ